jgi:HEPN domain-containing protein
MADSAMADLMLESARRDAVAFFKLVQDSDVHDSIIGFHAQQAVEKALKAALFKRAVPVPRTHRIGDLLDTLHDAGIGDPPHADSLDELNPYAVQARYGTLESEPLDRAVAAVRLTAVMAWASTFWPE